MGKFAGVAPRIDASFESFAKTHLNARRPLPLALCGRHAGCPAAGAESGEPGGPPQNDRPWTYEVVGRQPAGPRG